MKNNKIFILLAEDDVNMGLILQSFLNAKGFEVLLARNGVEALTQYNQSTGIDMALVDVMMPEKDGFSLAADLKSLSPALPLIFLTAKSMQNDILKGFEIGADDYITKPFSMDVLLARITALINRSVNIQHDSDQPLLLGKLVFDYSRQTISDGKESVKMTSKEAQLLKFLAENKNSITDRKLALELIWGKDDYYSSRSMDVYITKLRKMLKLDKSIELINVHGQGYKLMCS
ncbi:MAG: two-component system response regulator [Bacteroidetes bacterium GWF2_43_63]|nr:MAG: two-component system response regulator [Bacteroidetes bacterium GWE2_42_42]OFY53259.1 MAG: two-component system response regulator [Bacteroidetes bacterium GWF2_43_63]HBG71749.1 DNA-binding response regulator [Bacteroidales bacterium]HCB61586.1 DNA-binding response regulator [Bacteroidales bacterium]HCY22798.1 DNA-binding response regulator [Bacteroidales bacterium]